MESVSVMYPRRMKTVSVPLECGWCSHTSSPTSGSRSSSYNDRCHKWQHLRGLAHVLSGGESRTFHPTDIAEVDLLDRNPNSMAVYLDGLNPRMRISSRNRVWEIKLEGERGAPWRGGLGNRLLSSLHVPPLYIGGRGRSTDMEEGLAWRSAPLVRPQRNPSQPPWPMGGLANPLSGLPSKRGPLRWAALF
jgi:hypothetical protein